MLTYIKKYPISIFTLIAILYLSFFKPISTGLDKIPHVDKIVHVCMYTGLSSILWIEFLRAHCKKKRILMTHAWIGAWFCPIIFSGCIELMQEYLTTYRGGDILDLAANATGATLASLIGYFLLRPYMIKRYNKKTKDNQ